MTHPNAAAAAAALQHLADEAWDGFLAWKPLAATVLGDRRFLVPLTPNDAGADEREAARLTALVARVRELDASLLSPKERVTRSALLDQLGHEIGLVESRLDRWILNPLDGPQVEFLNVPSYQPIETEAEGRAAIERWREMAPWIDRHVASLRSSADAGLISPRSLVAKVTDELDDLLGRPDADWPLNEPGARQHPGWSTSAREQFAADLGAVVRDEIRPAFERLGAAVTDDIGPRARSDDEPGLCHVAGGVDAYRHLVRAHTTLDLDPEAIHAIGLAEIERITEEFAELGGRVLGAVGVAATLERLRTDPALYFQTPDEVFGTAEAALRRANEAIPGWFGRLPVAPCEVVAMAAHELKHSTIAYYRQPAADGSRPGRYYINTTLPETRPRYEAECLAFHESVPGHHLQLAIAQELEGLPAFRRFGGATAFIEGWGLYTERLSDEMGLYSGDLDRFGVLSFDAWRASRLVVDTGMHALGWTRRQAIDYMLQNTALAENNVINEVDRYIATPGQALAYKLGQLELRRLRTEASAALGPRFAIKAFHDTVLGEGAVGLATLRGVVETWVGTESGPS